MCPQIGTSQAGCFKLKISSNRLVRRAVGRGAQGQAIIGKGIDEWLELGEHSGYLTYVLESLVEGSSEVMGYVCFGPTPLTESTYDLYWIAVDKSKHRGGVGKRLMKFTEEEIARRGGQKS